MTFLHAYQFPLAILFLVCGTFLVWRGLWHNKFRFYAAGVALMALFVVLGATGS